MINCREISCKSILNKSGIPGIDFALNPYVGCEHKCAYCYAVFIKRFSNHSEEWGEFVDVKVNAPEILQRQLKSLKSKYHISIGTVCDAYQPIEAKFQMTRKCLEILRYFRHSISILTKSSLVLRDLDILSNIKELEIGFTVTTLNPNIKMLFEPCSSSVEDRLSVLKTLAQKGIYTWLFVAPIIPYISDTEEEIYGLLNAAEESGAQNITFDSLNPYPKVWHNTLEIIHKNFPDHIKDYHHYYSNKIHYEREIKERILRISESFHIKIDFAF